MAKKRTPKGRWSSQDLSALRRMFPTTPTSKVAQKVGRKLDAVKKKASRMGLKKARAYLKRIGRA
ncbi:MAG: hypothetical protein ABSH16_02740 [Sedimentisphaerales bacterium]